MWQTLLVLTKASTSCWFALRWRHKQTKVLCNTAATCQSCCSGVKQTRQLHPAAYAARSCVGQHKVLLMLSECNMPKPYMHRNTSSTLPHAENRTACSPGCPCHEMFALAAQLASAYCSINKSIKFSEHHVACLLPQGYPPLRSRGQGGSCELS